MQKRPRWRQRKTKPWTSTTPQHRGFQFLRLWNKQNLHCHLKHFNTVCAYLECVCLDSPSIDVVLFCHRQKVWTCTDTLRQGHRGRVWHGKISFTYSLYLDSQMKCPCDKRHKEDNLSAFCPQRRAGLWKCMLPWWSYIWQHSGKCSLIQSLRPRTECKNDFTLFPIQEDLDDAIYANT